MKAVIVSILVFSVFLSGPTVSSRPQVDNREQKRAVDPAAIWNGKGIGLFKEKKYSEAVECFQKAAMLNPLIVVYATNLSFAYRKLGKYEEARRLLEEYLKKFPGKEDQKKLQIELAKVHFRWAKSFEKRFDYANVIIHYKKAYAIDIVYRPERAAIDLNNIAFVYSVLGLKKNALDYYDKALIIMRNIGDHFKEATTLNNIGSVHDDLGRKQKALDYYEKALTIRRDIGDRSGEATTLNNIGSVYADLDRKQEALGYYEKAFTIMSSIENRAGKATTLNNIGRVYSDLNRNHKALQFYKKALAIRVEMRDYAGAAGTLNNIGYVYCSLGRNQKALQYFKKTLSIAGAIANRALEVTTINNIGSVYSSLGHKQRALGYYEKALPISRAIEDRALEATTLGNIGSLYSSLSRNREALDYFEKTIQLHKATGDRSGEATTLSNIGYAYSSLSQNQKALEYFEKAFQIFKDLGDRAGESTALSNIGNVCSAFGRNQKAMEYFEKSLLISRAIGDRDGEAGTLNNIGKIYSALGGNQKALDYFEKALPILRTVGNRTAEATTLNNIGRVYSALGRNRKALNYYEKALPILRAVGNRTGEASNLSNIGVIYFNLGQSQYALEYYKKAIQIMRAIGDRTGETGTLINIGIVYSNLGQNQIALDYYKKALLISRVIEDRNWEATILNNIGAIYSDIGRNREALNYYERSLPILRGVGNRSLEAVTLNNIGAVYALLGRNQKALDHFEKAIKIDKTIGERAVEAIALSNIGGVYIALGRNQKALDYFEEALPIKRAVEDRAGEAHSLSNIMVLWKDKKNAHLSIYYGKRSINVYQSLRKFISGLKKELQISYLEKHKETYRILADLLITQGRISEAQSVLDLLKIQEYYDFIRSAPASTNRPTVQLDFTPFEQQWLNKYNTHVDKLSNISNEYHVLIFKKNKNDAEKKRTKELGIKLKEETKVYKRYLLQLKKSFDKHQKEIEEGKLTPVVLAQKARQLQQTLKYLDQNKKSKHAALHYLVYGERISVILTTPNSQSVKQTSIDEKQFNLMIINYRNLITDLGKLMRGIKKVDSRHRNLETMIKKKREYEEKLYKIIFQPVDQDLIRYGATNLMVSLDGVLRYIPLTILRDGESYLVQRYRIALITPSSLSNIRHLPVKKKQILALGAGAGGEGFSPLPYVAREIRSIVRDEERGYFGLIKGKAFLNEDFTRDIMMKQLESKRYPFVHISSHFKFSPGDETKNHLLLGNGTILKLSEIRSREKLFDNVNLLVLSACETGVGGNGEEVDGFGELAQQSGAKSVIASLWSVADESTKELMVSFYKILKEGKAVGKIEALRRAQLELAGLEDLLAKGYKRGRRNSKYSHPYYWGPFIMMGNWR